MSRWRQPQSLAVSSSLQIQNIGIGHAAVVNVARSHGARSVAAVAAGAGDVHAMLGGALAGAAIVVGGDEGRGPFVEDALGDAGQRLARSAGDERNQRELMIGVERAGAEGVARLLREL